MVTRQNTSQDQDKPSKRFPLVGGLLSRDNSSSKDQRFLNLYVETDKNPHTGEKLTYLVKRPGYTLHSTPKPGGGTARGIFYWNGQLWSAYGNQIYRDLTLTGTTLGTSIGRVSFTEFRGGANNYLIIADSVAAYYVTTGNIITQITDVDFTGFFHGIIPAVLDGYLFFNEVATDSIYNSDLNDPTSWSGQKIAAEMYPDDVQFIGNHHNQLVAVGRYSVEFFNDTANTDTSPLTRTEGTSYQFGTWNGGLVVSTDNILIIPSQTKTGGRAVHMFVGFQLEKISTPYVDRIMDDENLSDSSFRVGNIIKTNGHVFYVMRLSTRTLVYDLNEKFWTEWTHNTDGTHTIFPFLFYTDNQSGHILMQHDTNGSIYKLDASVYTDSSTPILCEGWTVKFDMETMSRKFNHGLYFVAEDPGVSTQLQFRWSDDDYQSWSNWKTVNLHERPFFSRLGAFRRRAFHFKVSSEGVIKLEALEFSDMQTGNN